LPSASDPAGARSRSGRGLLGIVVFVALAALYPVVVSNPYLRYVGVLTVMYMGLATAWNLMGGFTGYVSLGHSAFFGLGAYATGLLATRLGLPPLLTAVLAGVLVGLVAAAIGYVGVRVRGASFVIVTIALVYISSLVAQGWRGLTGGSSGFTVPRAWPDIPRGQLHQRYFWAFLVLLLAVMALWWFIDRSKFGLGLKAIREDEDKAESLGVGTTAFKITAFALSAGMTAVGGGLYASWFGFLDPIFVFSILVGANLVLMSLLGGIRTLWGPALGAGLLVPSTDYFLVLLGETQAHLVATGLLLGVVVLVMPDGIIPAVRSRLGRRRPPGASIRETRAEPAGAPATSEVGG
jgi:branched-chain amino acid transport system permease protein